MIMYFEAKLEEKIVIKQVGLRMNTLINSTIHFQKLVGMFQFLKLKMFILQVLPLVVE